ncbi:MAG: 6-phosphofructokinase [Bacteroidota bacterium]
MKKIAFLTSGGDSPGMNACLRAIAKTAVYYGIEPYGIRDGYKGMIAGDIFVLGEEEVLHALHLGGTILGTARSEEFKEARFRQKAIGNLKELGIEGLVVIGGDGTFTGATILAKEMQIPVIGIPGTIDNDIYGTDRTIGYDTALNTVVEAIDKIRDTAQSHHRVFFIEVMGRNSGFIALNAAIASGIDLVLIPEQQTDIKEVSRQLVESLAARKSAIVIVAEGDDGGGANELIQKMKEILPDVDMRSTVLGHLQRGGAPSAFDRILATKMGIYAVDLLVSGKTGLMVASKGDILYTIPIEEGIKYKNAPLSLDTSELIKKILSSN